MHPTTDNPSPQAVDQFLAGRILDDFNGWNMVTPCEEMEWVVIAEGAKVFTVKRLTNAIIDGRRMEIEDARCRFQVGTDYAEVEDRLNSLPENMVETLRVYASKLNDMVI